MKDVKSHQLVKVPETLQAVVKSREVTGPAAPSPRASGTLPSTYTWSTRIPSRSP